MPSGEPTGHGVIVGESSPTETAEEPNESFRAAVGTYPSTCGSPSEEEELAAFEDQKAAHRLGKSRLVDGMLVLAATVLGGSGMLGIPHALASTGWLLGSGLLVLFCLFSAFGSHLLACAARKIGQAPCSFYTTAEAVAPNWTWLIDGAVSIKCFGVATSYLIIVGDLAPPALRHFGWDNVRRWQVVSIGFAIGGSLALLKHLSKLRYIVSGSLLIVIWTVVLLALFWFDTGDSFLPCGAPQDHLPCDGARFRPVVEANAVTLLKAFPIFIFGFTCQQNIFTVCNEVKNASRRRIDLAILGSYSAAFTLFLFAALFGYATYGENVGSNVLKGYPATGVVQATRVLYSFVAIFSFPLQIHPSRLSVLALVDFARGTRCYHQARGIVAVDEEGLVSGQVWSTRTCKRLFAITTVLLLFGSFGIAVALEDLGKILGVVGATGSTTVSYILPGLVYTQAFQQPSCERRLAQLQLLLGCIIMPVCLTVIFIPQ